MKIEKRYRKVLYGVVSLVLLLIFGSSMIGMTYMDSRSIQKEMNVSIARAEKKADRLGRELKKMDGDQEELVYQYALGMSDINDLAEEGGLSLSYDCRSKQEGTILESGNLVFYHFYESYKDLDGDTVFAENMQKILRLDDYFSKEEIAEIAHMYREQGEEAAIAVEGGYDGLYLLPTKITLLGCVPEREEIPDKASIWEKKGSSFLGQEENYWYYKIKEKTFAAEQDMEGKVPENAVVECEVSFASDESQNSITKRIGSRIASDKTGIWKTKKNVTISKGNIIFCYNLTGYPVAKAVEHLHFFYFVAGILFLGIEILLYIMIRFVFLKQEQFHENQKMLTRAIAHELKTPLSIIQGYCEGLMLQSEKEKMEEYATTIIEETREMNSLVLDMLELSRLETKGCTLELEEIQMGELIQAVKKQYGAVFRDKNISFSLEADGEWMVFADLSGMRKVVSNLLSNALKHAPDGGIIKVTMERQGKNGCIRFYNNGARIPEKVRKHIWDGYYHASEEAGMMLRSTGLGLTIVRHILDLHGFSYGCENLDVGVEFYIKMKVLPDEKNEEEKIVDWNPLEGK